MAIIELQTTHGMSQTITRHLVIEVKDAEGLGLATETTSRHPMSWKVFYNRREIEQQLIANKK